MAPKRRTPSDFDSLAAVPDAVRRGLARRARGLVASGSGESNGDRRGGERKCNSSNCDFQDLRHGVWSFELVIRLKRPKPSPIRSRSRVTLPVDCQRETPLCDIIFVWERPSRLCRAIGSLQCFELWCPRTIIPGTLTGSPKRREAYSYGSRKPGKCRYRSKLRKLSWPERR